MPVTVLPPSARCQRANFGIVRRHLTRCRPPVNVISCGCELPSALSTTAGKRPSARSALVPIIDRMTDTTPAGDDAPRSYLDTPTVQPSGMAGRLQLRAGSAEAVLAVVPHMLGFYPSRSLVVLGLGERNRVRVTFRYDIPDPPDAELAADIADHAAYVLNRERIGSAMLIGYGPEVLVNPVAGCVVDGLIVAGVRVPDALRADGGRYWSLFCDDPSCCPPAGKRYDPGSHPAAAEMSAAGLTAHPDREALVRTLQSAAGSSEAILGAANLARVRCGKVVAQSQASGEREPQLRLARVGRAAVQRAIRLYRAGGSIANPHQLARLAVLLTDLRVRDDAWARMDPSRTKGHLRLWTDVLKGTSIDYVPAPAALLAFTAWQAGNGALAAVAVDRALAADPEYSMALLLSSALQAGLPPSAAKMPMTPAEVAGSYAAVGDDAPADRDRAARRSSARRSGARRRSTRAGRRQSSAGRSGSKRSSGGRSASNPPADGQPREYRRGGSRARAAGGANRR